MATPTSTGMNRTGIQMAPRLSELMLEISHDGPAQPAETLPLAQARMRFSKEAAPVGTVPPPGSVKGLASTALQMLKGNKPSVFLDKVGERLAFERTGVRLYEGVLVKHEALGSWDGGPTGEQLIAVRDDELAHFEMLKGCMESLGGDPTAMTPSADITANEASGVLKVITDARSTLPQALHALLIAEAADVEGWNLLIELARGIGQDELAARFEDAERAEERHLHWVRQWLSSAVMADANRELGSGGH